MPSISGPKLSGIRDGKLFRAVQGDRITGQGITAQTVFLVVERFAKALDMDAVAAAR